jgi:hypothetical protein
MLSAFCLQSSRALGSLKINPSWASLSVSISASCNLKILSRVELMNKVSDTGKLGCGCRPYTLNSTRKLGVERECK